MAAAGGARARGRRRVLLVEDSPERIAWFRRRFRTAVLKVARNYADAVKALGGPRFDLVLLDHDIDDAAHNGQDVAAFMAMRLARCRRPARVVVHSTNPAGALGIERTLVRAGFVVDGSPFPPACLTRVVRALRRRVRAERRNAR